MRNWRRKFAGFIGLIGVVAVLIPALALTQTADFQIVWINIGEVAAAQPTRAGRQLFMAPDLVQFSLDKVTVARVDIEPAVVPLKMGDRFCLTSLRVVANSDDHKDVENAPLSVSVRQDQRERLGLKRTKKDICFRPTTGGEYPVRFNSLLPARDGTTRGAQIFIRVEAETASTAPTVSSLSYRPIPMRL